MTLSEKIIKETDKLMKMNENFYKEKEYEKAFEIGEIANNILIAFKEEQENHNKYLDGVIKRLDI